ncbi:MAG TPA: thiamine pyrophosphate-dependent enzyme [Candidatus Angelobacter sp.]
MFPRLQARNADHSARRAKVEAAIAKDKSAYREEWRRHINERVNPALFFAELRRQLRDDAIMTVDDGNHTFLAAELFEVRLPRCFVSPTDFNSMGYAVPAAVGAKLANPLRQVVSIVGDGAFLMTGLETITAATLGLHVTYFIFNDGELSQISQGQEIPYNRKSCTTLGEVQFQGIAEAVGAQYIAIKNNSEIESGIQQALSADSSDARPVIVDVRIDYSKRTRFTQGVVKTALKTFPFRGKARFLGRALIRKITG